MLKNLTLGLMGVLALTFFTNSVLAQEERELTTTQDDTSVNSDDYQYLYNTLDDYSNGDYDYSNLSEELTPDEQAALAGIAALTGGAMLVVAGISAVFGLIVYAYTSYAFMVIAKRLNVENGWFAWVPVLNLVLLAKLGDVNPWQLLLILVPIVNIFYLIYFSVVTSMKMCEKLGLEKYLGLLMLVPVVNYVFLGYMAWGKFEKKSAPVVTA